MCKLTLIKAAYVAFIVFMYYWLFMRYILRLIFRFVVVIVALGSNKICPIILLLFSTAACYVQLKCNKFHFTLTLNNKKIH